MTWGPRFTLQWGPYAKPDPADVAAKVKNATDARDGGLITLRTAVDSIARDFDIGDIDAYLEALDDERVASVAVEAKALHEAAREAHDASSQDRIAAAGSGAGAGAHAPGAGGAGGGPDGRPAAQAESDR